MSDAESWRRPARVPPPFACAWGDDEFGLWAELKVTSEVGSARQKMRWIEPGTFWMGSPTDEPERLSHEGPRHLVSLTHGLWLADTPCTQALWNIVMGSNPSSFKGDELPVENVNWADAQGFLRALQTRFAAADFQLPTEAEWEYACRAGTTQAFSFGENITAAQVNYDGTHPYAGGEQGEYRMRTVPVKSLPANRWGLYEMHGNVWEWCADGLREYGSTAVLDPVGAVENDQARRVLRGGSCFSHGWRMRSAYRDASPPGDRSGFIGLRVCSRSK